jgi:hypothetical protein
MIIDENITLRDFTRAIQHRSTFAIPKANMRLKKFQDDSGTWERFFCTRSKTDYERAIYDDSLSSMGIIDNTLFKVEWVLSKGNIGFLAVGGVMAIPAGAAASVVAYGVVSAAYVSGFIIGTVAGKAAIQRAFAKSKAVILPRDMPKGILEIQKF